MNPHGECFMDEPCALGKPAECPTQQAMERRAHAKEGRWSTLQVGRAQGERHYLDGEPIHCGTRIELQAIEHRDDDFGEYIAVLQRGIVVRYELAGGGPLINRVVLYVAVDGHLFTTRLESWMRFRWPARSS